MMADERERLLARARLADPAKAGYHLHDPPRELAKRRLVVDSEHQHVVRGRTIYLAFDRGHGSRIVGAHAQAVHPACLRHRLR
jgi:hypothetical protein